MPSVSPARRFLGCSWVSDEKEKHGVLGTRRSGPDPEFWRSGKASLRR